VAIIEFVRDEFGQQPVLNHLNALKALSAANDPDATWIMQRISRALKFVALHGIPSAIQPVFSDTDDAGNPFTLAQPVKQLIHHRPILELRVNKQGYGAFRALFFPYEHLGQQILVFTRSVLKSGTSDPAFDLAVAETEAIIPDFMINPKKYINL